MNEKKRRLAAERSLRNELSRAGIGFALGVVGLAVGVFIPLAVLMFIFGGIRLVMAYLLWTWKRQVAARG